MTEALKRLYTSLEILTADVITNGTRIRQGYLPLEIGVNLAQELHCEADFAISEARLRDRGGQLTFTIKGEGGTSRGEIETEIDDKTFKEFWHHTRGKRVEKIRLQKSVGGRILEIDVYTDRKLVVAEMEVDSMDDLQRLEPFGEDISEDRRYKNKNLAR